MDASDKATVTSGSHSPGGVVLSSGPVLSAGTEQLSSRSLSVDQGSLGESRDSGGREDEKVQEKGFETGVLVRQVDLGYSFCVGRGRIHLLPM